MIEIVKMIDAFVRKYYASATENEKDKMKAELLELAQKALDIGAEKDQNKISGLLVKGIKAFMGGKD